MISDKNSFEEDIIIEIGYESIIIPLLDALKWKGSRHRLNESLTRNSGAFSVDNVIETMSNLKFSHYEIDQVKGRNLNKNWLPMFVQDQDFGVIVLNIDNDMALVFDYKDETYKRMSLNNIKGKGHYFIATQADLGKTKSWFTKLMFRFKKSLVQIGVLTLLMTLLDLAIPGFVMIIYDQVSKVQSMTKLFVIGLGISIYIGASLVFGYLRSKVTDYISVRMGAIISLETYTRLLYLSPSYTESASVNSQINRIKDFENLKRFVSSGIFLSSIDLMFSVIYLIVIFALGGWLVYIPIITFILVMLIGITLKPFHKIKSEAVSESGSQKQQLLIEILKNSEAIRMSNAKEHWVKRFKMLNAEHIFSKYELSNYVNTTNSISYFICNGSVLAFIYGGVLRVFDKSMTMGALIGLLMLYWKVIGSIRGSFSLFVQISGLVKSVNQINRFMNLPQDSQIEDGKKPSKPMQGNVVFKDVSMRYSQSSNPALVNISFNISSNEICGIYGHDGSGKTTILKLILGMYKPQIGRILIDGVNIRQLEPLSVRQSISYTSENSIIISGTVRNNFLFYNSSITDEEIKDIIEKVGLSNYFKQWNIELDTVLSDKDLQRIPHTVKKLFSIARMLCRDVKLYLMDEPENYLSIPEIEKIMSCIKDKAQTSGATVIIATKSEEILSYCDKVININDGRLVKQNARKED